MNQKSSQGAAARGASPLGPAWRAHLDGIAAPTALPGDGFPLTENQEGRTRAKVSLAPDAARALFRLAEERNTPLSAFAELAWALVLGRANGETDVVFGAASDPDFRRDAGRATVVPCRVLLEPGTACAELAVRHGARFGEIRRDAPAIEACRAFVGFAEGQPLFESEVVVSAAPLPSDAAALSLGVVVGSGIEIHASADPLRLDPYLLEQCAGQLARALAALALSPKTPLEDVVLVAPDEGELVTRGWNRAADEPGPEATVPELFARQAATSPDAVAVALGDDVLTYRELAERARAFAGVLQALGVLPGDRVALCLERSTDLIVTLLAILEAGAAYVPIEPTYPRSRMEFMLADAEPRVFVTEGAWTGELSGLPCAPTSLETLRERAGSSPFRAASFTPEHGAYVIYTSGSTGTPKGVEVPQRAIERLVKNVTYARLGPEQVILQAAPVAFDASTFEIWGALLNGGRVVLYPEPVPTAHGLGRAIRHHGVTTLWLTAALFNAVIDEDATQLAPLKELLIGGEALSVHHVRRAYEKLSSTLIINGYGPTETTTFATCFPIPRLLPKHATSIPIGAAIRKTRLYVLDAKQRPVPVGSVGELFIGGRGVALGYLKRPELTSERFVDDPFVGGEKMYRTGDLVRFRRDGVVDYVGRADQQVKIRGFRIELGEIEHALAKLSGVRAAAVLAQRRGSGEKRLVAYLVPTTPGSTLKPSELRKALAESLPEYMVPSAFVWLAALPVTLNGKLDHRALPDPTTERPDLGVEYVAPEPGLETTLANAWAEALDLERVGVLDNFFDLGANSLMAVKLVAKLEREHKLSIPVVQVFQRPSVRELVRALERRPGDSLAERLGKMTRRSGGGAARGFAIVGMAGRFPGAATVEELWKNLCDGKESISQFSAAELDPSVPSELARDPAYVRARGVLSDVEHFDTGFFGLSPKEAVLTDPQQRVLLEVAWEALENAGYSPEGHPGAIGVFAGKYNNSYYSENVVTRPDLIAEFGAFNTMLANEKDYIATRIAHRLNLTGPALSIHTACSTSLVAVVQAIQSLEAGQCDLALAGGVTITVPVKSGYLYQEGAMLSPDGHTRSFDANAQGTVFSDGAAMVVLKRLEDAVEDGDTIYAVVRGGAINNDGSNKASFTAPSVDGQALVVAMAQADAGVKPRDISYVEAHGTATPLGDPIEVEGLTKAFREKTDERKFCGIGSVKSNVGHLVIAAGATGLIKVALALKTEQIPPTILFDAPNPKIDFENSPFYVVSRLTPWPAGREPRLAGVSSFGVGGTNAHVVVGEAPPRTEGPSARATQLLLLSARSEAALGSATERLAARLSDASAPLSLADAAFTLHAGRTAFPHRRAVVASSPEEASSSLRSLDARRVVTRKASPRAPGVAFMFPGQGAQHVGMGRSLYREQPVFRSAFDVCSEILLPLLGEDLRRLIFEPETEAAGAEALKQTAITQPALFVIEYALAMLWESYGVVPKTMIGHSVGEFVCATLAKVWSVEEALGLVAARGRMMQDQPSGSMLSVRRPAREIEARLDGGLTIASDNSPTLCVVAGPTDEVARFEKELAAAEVPCRLLVTSHAFHSSMMDPVVEPFRRLVEKVALREPEIPFVSTATGEAISRELATDPSYWARHLRLRVRFAEGVKTLIDQPELVLLEVGPRSTLATLARQQITDKSRACLATLADSDEASWSSLLLAAGQLWSLGVPLDAKNLHGPEPRRRVPLPTYPFERKRFWIEPASQPASPLVSVAAPAAADPSAAAPTNGHANGAALGADGDGVSELIAHQIAIMTQQLALLGQLPADEDGDLPT